MEFPADIAVAQVRRCLSCRRDAPLAFFSQFSNGRVKASCNYCAGRSPPLPEWVDAKLSRRVRCECGAEVVPTSLSRHRVTAAHCRAISGRAAQDAGFAAHIVELEAARDATLRDNRARQDAYKVRVVQDARVAAAVEAAKPPPRVLTEDDKICQAAFDLRFQARRVALGLPAVHVQTPKLARIKCPDCGSEIANNTSNLKAHRKTKKHLKAIKARLSPPPAATATAAEGVVSI